MRVLRLQVEYMYKKRIVPSKWKSTVTYLINKQQKRLFHAYTQPMIEVYALKTEIFLFYIQDFN